MYRMLAVVSIIGSLATVSNCAAASSDYACVSAVADATTRFFSAGFVSPEKPMQFAIEHRGPITVSGAEFRFLAGSLRRATALCRAGDTDAAAERLVPVLATLDRLERSVH